MGRDGPLEHVQTAFASRCSVIRRAPTVFDRKSEHALRYSKRSGQFDSGRSGRIERLLRGIETDVENLIWVADHHTNWREAGNASRVPARKSVAFVQYYIVVHVTKEETDVLSGDSDINASSGSA